MSLLDKRDYYKPFKYPWAFTAYETQQKMHWLPQEVSLSEDVKDWKQKLTKEEKNLLTQIFRFFTQGDVDVAKGYLHRYIPIFGHNPEVAMMLISFANMEAVHVHAYSYLLDTLGLPETEYKAFTKYEAMKAKHDYVEKVAKGDPYEELCQVIEKRNTAKQLAVYSAFTEGLQLFSSFAILLNFSRFGKMKGMSTIVQWSIRDETLHVENMIKLFRQFIKENPEIWTDEFKGELYEICRKMVELEDAFIDLAFEQGGIEGLTSEEVKAYVRYLADRRLLQLGLKANYKVKTNPLEWLDELLIAPEHTNFFETRPTAYSKHGAAVGGDW